MQKYLHLFVKSISSLALMFITLVANAQVGIGTTTPNSSAALDVNSISKGMLIPRLSTAQRNAIINPAQGLIVFDTDKGTILLYDGSAWSQCLLQIPTKHFRKVAPLCNQARMQA